MTMSMEIQNLELTIGDILLMHRGWITKVFVEDQKSDVEIVGLLYERRLLVTLAQMRKCIREWELIPPPSGPLDTEPQAGSIAITDAPEVVGSGLPSPINVSLADAAKNTPIEADSDTSDLDSNPPLHYSPTATAKRKSCDKSSGDDPKLSSTNSLALDDVANNPWSIETYVTQDQPYERLAIVLEAGTRDRGGRQLRFGNRPSTATRVRRPHRWRVHKAPQAKRKDDENANDENANDDNDGLL